MLQSYQFNPLILIKYSISYKIVLKSKNQYLVFGLTLFIVQNNISLEQMLVYKKSMVNC